MKKILFVFIFIYCLSACASKQDNIVIVPEFIDLSNSCLYGYENPKYIYRENVATLNCHYFYGE